MKLKEDMKKKALSFYSNLSRKEKDIFRKTSVLIHPKKKILTFDDLMQFEIAKDALLPIKERYSITLNELFSFVKNQLFLPIQIFNKKLTVLESIVTYLKEEKSFSFRHIADLIGRDERNIWGVYNRSGKKQYKKPIVNNARIWIPVSIFSDTTLSALESIVKFLKEELEISYHEIACLLKRDDRTIWTVYMRAKKKYEK